MSKRGRGQKTAKTKIVPENEHVRVSEAKG